MSERNRHDVEATDDLWSAERTSAYLGVPVSTLYQWRHRGIGSRSFKVGRFLRYNPSDIWEWLTERAA